MGNKEQFTNYMAQLVAEQKKLSIICLPLKTRMHAPFTMNFQDISADVLKRKA